MEFHVKRSAGFSRQNGPSRPSPHESLNHPHLRVPASKLAKGIGWMQLHFMQKIATFTARVVRDGEWFIAFSPEFPEGNGQGSTEEEALESLRESILLLLEDRREDAAANLGNGEKLIPLTLG